MTDEILGGILAKRDQFDFESEEWNSLNLEKAEYLESIKPSNKERIVYFEEDDLGDIDYIFTDKTDIFSLPFGIERRSLLEYHPTRRHPIPYVLIRFKNKYFFILREKGAGELRLIGKKGLIGGHIGEEDVEKGDLKKTFYNALLREIEEEIGVGEDMIREAKLRGLIRSDLGVDFDHLGLVYEVELVTDKIKSEEEDILTGIWIGKDELKNHYESFENWSKIVCDSLLI